MTNVYSNSERTKRGIAQQDPDEAKRQELEAMGLEAAEDVDAEFAELRKIIDETADALTEKGDKYKP